MKNTTREKSRITKPLGMKWYKFLIYFALFAGAFVNFIYGINYISGGIYAVETNGLVTADTVYKLYGVGLQVVDILYGLFLLAFAVFGLVLRNQLAKYKPDAPHFVRIFYSISAGAPFLYSVIVALITSQPLGIEAMLSLIVGLIFTLWNVEYFKKRAHLFTDNPTIMQEDAPAPSQIQNDVPVTPSATVTEESPEESNVATENNPPQEEKAIQGENAPQKAKRYCSLCGGEIDADTKQCTKCGKQYFKGFTKNEILILVSALLVIAILSIIIVSLLNPQKNSSEKETGNSITNSSFIPNGNNKNPSHSAMEEEIEAAESKSAYNKSQYERQYKYYMSLERYTGTQSAYNLAQDNLSAQIGQAYADCQNKISKIYNSNIFDGQKEAYKRQYEDERDRKISELSTQKINLQAAWENQQNYLRYYNLYLEEDEKLANEIQKIRDKYNN